MAPSSASACTMVSPILPLIPAAPVTTTILFLSFRSIKIKFYFLVQLEIRSKIYRGLDYPVFRIQPTVKMGDHVAEANVMGDKGIDGEVPFFQYGDDMLEILQSRIPAAQDGRFLGVDGGMGKGKLSFRQPYQNVTASVGHVVRPGFKGLFVAGGIEYGRGHIAVRDFCDLFYGPWTCFYGVIDPDIHFGIFESLPVHVDGDDLGT